MPKYRYSLVKEGLYIYEFDNEEPPHSGKKILQVTNKDFKTAAFVVRALNARYQYEKKISNGK